MSCPDKKTCTCGETMTAMALACYPPAYYDWCQKCGASDYRDKPKIEPKDERPLSREVAALLLEDVLDTLVEVGNGTSDEDLRLACMKLFLFRDAYFNKEGC